MANRDIPNGFTPVRHLNGNPWNGKFRVHYLHVDEGTDTFIGDPMEISGSADSSGKYATVNQAAVGETVIGIVIGFGDTPYLMADTTNLSRVYRPLSTAMYVGLVDDPDVIFEIQEDGVDRTMDADDVGQVFEFVFTESGDTTSGLSGCEVDGGSSGGSGIRILGLSDRPDNELGANAKWEVLIVGHEMRSVSGA